MHTLQFTHIRAPSYTQIPVSCALYLLVMGDTLLLCWQGGLSLSAYFTQACKLSTQLSISLIDSWEMFGLLDMSEGAICQINSFSETRQQPACRVKRPNAANWTKWKRQTGHWCYLCLCILFTNQAISEPDNKSLALFYSWWVFFTFSIAKKNTAKMHFEMILCGKLTRL